MSRSILQLALACLLLSALAACATSGGSTASSSDKRLQPAQHRVDTERVAMIERAARARGVDVHWVNPPRKLVQNGSGSR